MTEGSMDLLSGNKTTPSDLLGQRVLVFAKNKMSVCGKIKAVCFRL